MGGRAAVSQTSLTGSAASAAGLGPPGPDRIAPDRHGPVRDGGAGRPGPPGTPESGPRAAPGRGTATWQSLSGGSRDCQSRAPDAGLGPVAGDSDPGPFPGPGRAGVIRSDPGPP
eukprot:196886-Hanusia_phi.AAC.3